ncbi:hypothetical protein [Thermococcus sp.]|uniref:hypothetical protein n=1 Tax=Thermococcus sp. TaxID=35749 RepID=UPI00260694CB|nr:hypothetical protein [Thermococcus sp.]
MSEQRDKAKEKSRYHKERKERERRKDTAIQPPTKATQTPQKAKEGSPEIKVSAQSEARKEPQKPEEKFKSLEKSVKVEAIHRPHKVVIPTVLITPSTPEYTQVEVDSGYYVQRRQQEVKIPLIQIDSPIFKFQSMPLNGEFTMREKVKVPAKFPRLKLHSQVFAITNSFLDSTVNIPSRPKYSPSAPRTMVSQTRGPQKKISLALTSKHEIKPIEVETTQESEALGLPETDNGSVIFEREFSDFVETLFGIGSNELKETNAVIILFRDIKNEGYIHLFEKFLLRLQREKGRVGKVKKLTLSSENWNMEEVERWLDEGGIIFVEVANKEILEKLARQDLADRLWAIFSKGDGIVVFHTEDDGTFFKINEIIQDINWNRLGLKPEIFKVVPRELPFNLKVKISRIIYGLVPIPDVAPNSKMSWIINTAEKQYLKALKRIMQMYEPFFPVKATDDESTEHLLAKYFIIHTLLKRIQKERNLPENLQEIEWDKIRKLIETEPETYPRPDVLYNPENEHFEFETLFGESFRKITNKLDEYSRAKPEAKVRVVVEPITVLLHLNEFNHQRAGTKKGKLYSNLDVEYYTFDLSKERLMTLEEFFKIISETLKELNKKTRAPD